MAQPCDATSTGEERTVVCPEFPRSGPAPALARYQAGSVLSGKYRLESLLAEGGMGAVWRATNLPLDLPVAIKLIRADLDGSALRARLQQEARSVAKLGHPAIVRIYDVGETEFGDPFIVMELLRGGTLAQLLAPGRLSAVRAVQLLLPIVDACAVAHARGIVHRDLKPDNLLIALDDQRTQPKILDFGIAKWTDPRDPSRLTEIGAVLGSPEYMSPEQARGRDDVDFRTDIWSLCVVLYEAVTGQVPFSAPNYNALVRAIVEDEPTPLLNHTAGDAELWEILKRGLAKATGERQGSMAELGQALARWLLLQGAHEDACGSSVESKWLRRSSDPLGFGPATRDRLHSFDSGLEPTPTHDSASPSGGQEAELRGPFTSTIRPKWAGRLPSLRVAALTCTVLGGLTAAFVFTPRGQSSMGPAQASVLATRAQSALGPAAAANDGPAVTTDDALERPALEHEQPTPDAPTVGEPIALSLTEAKSVSSTPRNAQSSRLGATRGNTVTAGPSRAAPAAPKSRSRELDLISPY
jgi:eukaryotic-like serine/threonine-protein kinase